MSNTMATPANTVFFFAPAEPSDLANQIGNGIGVSDICRFCANKNSSGVSSLKEFGLSSSSSRFSASRFLTCGTYTLRRSP